MSKRESTATIVKFQRLNPDAVIPEKASLGAAGFDLVSVEDATIKPMDRAVISTGIAMEVPPGFEAQVRPRSGLAAKYGVTVLNSPGTIDSDYRGEVKVILQNFGPTFVVKKGERIAQVVIQRVPSIQFETVEELTDTTRGTGGLGSTGR